MPLGSKKGIGSDFPEAQGVMGKFHVVKHPNEAPDSVRRREPKENGELNGTRFVRPENDCRLTESQTKQRKSPMKMRLRTGRVLMTKEEIRAVCGEETRYQDAEAKFGKLISWMMRSSTEEAKKAARICKRHFKEILNCFLCRKTNAVPKGMNSIIQNIRRRARGFRDMEYFKLVIYLNCGGLNIRTVKLA